MSSTAATIQMNVRIGRALKERGDAGLKAMGLTPTMTVRRVWELASGTNEQRDELSRLLSGQEEQMPTAREAAPAQDVLRGPDIFERHLLELGLALPQSGELQPYDKEADRQMLVDALMERHASGSEEGLA